MILNFAQVKEEPDCDDAESATAAATVTAAEEAVTQPSITDEFPNRTVVEASGQVSRDESEKIFKCWLCDFTFKEKAEIELHLRKFYQRDNDALHTHSNIAKMFNLDNPAVLLLNETASVYLKCLRCDEIYEKLSVFLVHCMMYCRYNFRGPCPSPTSSSSNIFDTIKVVESATIGNDKDVDIIKGSNDVAICSKIECGCLLNRFDVRPHKCADVAASQRLKCMFSSCDFEGEKKLLISHYCQTHLVRLSNVKLPPEEDSFLNSKRARLLDQLMNSKAQQPRLTASIASVLSDNSAVQAPQQQTARSSVQIPNSQSIVSHRAGEIVTSNGTIPVDWYVLGNSSNQQRSSAQLGSHSVPSGVQFNTPLNNSDGQPPNSSVSAATFRRLPNSQSQNASGYTGRLQMQTNFGSSFVTNHSSAGVYSTNASQHQNVNQASSQQNAFHYQQRAQNQPQAGNRSYPVAAAPYYVQQPRPVQPQQLQTHHQQQQPVMRNNVIAYYRPVANDQNAVGRNTNLSNHPSALYQARRPPSGPPAPPAVVNQQPAAVNSQQYNSNPTTFTHYSFNPS